MALTASTDGHKHQSEEGGIRGGRGSYNEWMGLNEGREEKEGEGEEQIEGIKKKRKEGETYG